MMRLTCRPSGMLRADLADSGTRLEVEIFGNQYPAVVQESAAVWDPKNERIRA